MYTIGSSKIDKTVLVRVDRQQPAKWAPTSYKWSETNPIDGLKSMGFSGVVGPHFLGADSAGELRI